MEAVTPLLTLHCVEFQDSRWRVLGRPGLVSGLLPPSAGVRRAVCPPPPHPLLHQPRPQQGHHQGGGQHTLQCWYQADQQGGVPLPQLHRAHSGSSGGLVTRGITSSVELCNKSQAE